MQSFKIVIFILIIISQSCQNSKTTNQKETPSQDIIIELIKKTQTNFIPDRRIARLDVVPVFKNDKWLLTGETTSKDAKDSLFSLLESRHISFEDQILLLPDSKLGKYTHALSRHSVANLRSEKGHSQELATQVLLGTPLLVLKQKEEWYFVQCPDGYLAWVHGGEIALKTAIEMEHWKQSDRLIFTAEYGHSFQDQQMHQPLGDLVMGNIITKIESNKNYTKITYPDERQAYIPTNQLQSFDEYLSENALSFNNTLAIARQQIGKPYLWGGTSPKAMDCSGFTKTLYWQQGIIIPRDASQQVQTGEKVVYDDELKGLQEGDLLFFGRYREDGTEKITHVGLYIGNGRFIHSGSDNGANKEQSLIPDTPDFAPHRRASLLQARRLSNTNKGVLNVSNHSWYW